jgi:hypothetical protein
LDGRESWTLKARRGGGALGAQGRDQDLKVVPSPRRLDADPPAMPPAVAVRLSGFMDV